VVWFSGIRAGVVAVALVLAACGGGATAVVETVSPQVAADLLASPDAVLLDIRTPDEFAAGHLVDAVNIDFYAPDFADRLAALDPATTYVVYCRSGNRTTAALDVFRDLGFTAVHAVDGGIVAWEAAGLGRVAP
jgi:rhodanese-related sulfurtransferase